MNFIKKNFKSFIFLLSFVAIVFISMAIANGIQKDFGSIDVTVGTFETTYKTIAGEEKTGKIAYKLYTPKTATATNKASALLLLHGYQNDHETSAAYALELARRGVVVLAIDEFGHGATSISLINRGYVNHKVTVNYGTDSEENKTFVGISGPERYKVMMNFSNMKFFLDKYSKDEEGNQILDSSMGGIAAYSYLSTLSYVDSTKMAVSGHSMGTWASWSVSANFSGTAIEPKATILQAGELFTKDAYDYNNIHFNNVLLLTAKWDEFNMFRDYSKQTVNDSIIQNDITSEFLGVAKGSGEWNTTYGNFGDGTARRRELVMTNHRLLTHNKKAIATTIDWLSQTIGINTVLENTDQVFLIKEYLVLVATLAALASMFALFTILIKIPFFSSISHPEIISERAKNVKTGWKWWKGAIITILIAGLSYPFMTQLGHGLLPVPEKTVFRMTIGNGFLSWYLFLIIIMLLTTILPWRKAKKLNIPKDYCDLGLSTPENKNRFDWVLLGKSAIVVLCMIAFMYIQCLICEKAFMLDFRFIWPFFKGFNLERFFQFLAYIPVFIVFFVLNNSKIFAQMRNSGADKPGLKGFLSCWWRNALLMVGGILILILIEYIPFFIGAGPGADLLFSSTFGGPFMSLMIVFVPQVLVFSVICTYTYRKTGSVYVGAMTVATLACLIITGGSAIL
jgi:dienelactone hydrolase